LEFYPADGQSTAAVSGAETPATSGQPRLKLTFNNGNSSNKDSSSATNGANSGAASDNE